MTVMTSTVLVVAEASPDLFHVLEMAWRIIVRPGKRPTPGIQFVSVNTVQMTESLVF